MLPSSVPLAIKRVSGAHRVPLMHPKVHHETMQSVRIDHAGHDRVDSSLL